MNWAFLYVLCCIRYMGLSGIVLEQNCWLLYYSCKNEERRSLNKVCAFFSRFHLFLLVNSTCCVVLLFSLNDLGILGSQFVFLSFSHHCFLKTDGVMISKSHNDRLTVKKQLPTHENKLANISSIIVRWFGFAHQCTEHLVIDRLILLHGRYKPKIGQLVFHPFFFSGLNSVACNRNKTWLVPGPACTKRKTNYCWSSLRDIFSFIRDPARKRWIYWLTKHFYRCSLKSTHDLQTLLQCWIVPLALVQLKFAKSLKIKLIVSVSYYFGVLSFVGVPSIYFSYLSENVQTRNL